MSKKAHKVVYGDGELLGVKTPYNREFIQRAKANGYIWTGRRHGSYWTEDTRLLMGAPIDIGQAIVEKRQALVALASKYFEFGDDLDIKEIRRNIKDVRP